MIIFTILITFITIIFIYIMIKLCSDGKFDENEQQVRIYNEMIKNMTEQGMFKEFEEKELKKRKERRLREYEERKLRYIDKNF